MMMLTSTSLQPPSTFTNTTTCSSLQNPKKTPTQSSFSGFYIRNNTSILSSSQYSPKTHLFFFNSILYKTVKNWGVCSSALKKGDGDTSSLYLQNPNKTHTLQFLSNYSPKTQSSFSRFRIRNNTSILSSSQYSPKTHLFFNSILYKTVENRGVSSCALKEGDGGDEEYSSPFEFMEKWMENKPSGFGEGKVYDTSVEDKLIEEIEHSRRVQLANVNKLKHNPIEPGGHDKNGSKKKGL